jgi:acetyl esterase/lipase
MAQDSGLRVRGFPRWLARFGAALGLADLLLSIWIVLPPPSHQFVPLVVGAPELSGWLFAASLVAVVFTGLAARRSRLAQVGLICGLAASVLASRPLVQFGSVARAASAGRQATLGDSTVVRLDVGSLFAGLKAGDARITRAIDMGSPGGMRLTMDVYQPPSASGRPAIVQIYGGAWQRGAPGDNPELATYLAAHGYVVFAIDYRHAPAFRWPAQIDDVRGGIDWIADHGREYGADPDRLVVLGRSAGAHLALVSAYTSTRRILAVVSLYGPTDLAAGYRELPSPDPLDVRGLLRALTGGTPDDRPDVYREASPITYATRRLPPTLLIYGSRDHIVLPRFAERLHERLRATGTTSLLVEIPWAEHAFDAITAGPSAQLARFEIERFLAWAVR